jgi:type IV pilus assembly protein PilE
MKLQRLHPPRAAGFTLIEMMIVIAIATILITIAVPAYLAQIRESHRTSARTALLDLAQREERFMSTNNSYTNDPTMLGYPAGQPIALPTNDYNLTICLDTVLPCAANAATGTTFNLTATAINAQAKDAQCLTLSVNNQGNQTQTGTSTTCWTH